MALVNYIKTSISATIMNVKLEESWKKRLENEFSMQYFIDLASFIKKEKLSSIIYPPGSMIFAALDQCSFGNLKVVILGQDPYHGLNQAHGLCFSVQEGIEVPPSLVNIFKEIHRDLGIKPSKSGNLTHWAQQGVLLLNATLTVRANQAGSHQNQGWERFTDAIIKLISDEKDNVVFLLWGNYARSKAKLINPTKHLILESSHPSPLSVYRGFLGCGHFSKTNLYLQKNNLTPIHWDLNQL